MCPIQLGKGAVISGLSDGGLTIMYCMIWSTRPPQSLWQKKSLLESSVLVLLYLDPKVTVWLAGTSHCPCLTAVGLGNTWV